LVELSAIAAALSSLKAAKDIAEAMIGLRDAQAFQAKLLEFQSKLIDANNSAFAAQDERSALLERIGKLEEEVTRLKTWEREKQRYKLERLPPGVLVYALKPEMAEGEPPHRICAACYQRGKKSFLQELDEGYAKCHDCGSELHWATGRGSFTVDYDPFAER
jgi:hypothetical protein